MWVIPNAMMQHYKNLIGSFQKSYFSTDKKSQETNIRTINKEILHLLQNHDDLENISLNGRILVANKQENNLKHLSRANPYNIKQGVRSTENHNYK